MAQTEPPVLNVFPRHGLLRRGLAPHRRLVYGLVPRHAWKPFKWELRMAWLRLRTRGLRRRFEGSRDLLVNIAPGPNGRDGWVNIDAVSRGDGVNCVYDCRRDLPFPDESTRGIFCENFVEHLDYTEEVPTFLSECHRVLAPGGVLRVVVPETRTLLEAYLSSGWSEIERLFELGADHRDSRLGGQYHTKLEAVNVAFRQGHEHRWMYDFETLAFVMRLCGFGKVLHQSFGKCELEELCIDGHGLAHSSLFVDAVKS